MPRYALSGKEHLVAKGIHEYYKKKDEIHSDEWVCYLNTGRSGRIDTTEVKTCLEQLMKYIINTANAETKDEKRYFSAQQRKEIFDKSNGTCMKCGIEITRTNFHADHIKAHTAGGETDISNGQALCTKCNREKGGSKELFD